MQPRKNKIDEKTLDAYTEELLLCLPEHASQLLKELADDYKLPIWQVFCGVVLEVHTQGNLSNFTVDPAWAEGLKQYDYVCKHCKKIFKPKHLGQVFCSNACGDAHQLGETYVSTPIAQPSGNAASDPDDLAKRIAKLSKDVKEGWGTKEQLPAE